MIILFNKTDSAQVIILDSSSGMGDGLTQSYLPTGIC